MNIQLIQDLINLKDLLDYIASFSSKHLSDCELNDKKKILMLILKHVSAPETNSAVTTYLKKIQKYLSADKPANIQIIDDINAGVWDKELKAATDKIYSLTYTSSEASSLYTSLFERCSPLHFSEDEFSSVSEAFNNKRYDDMLFLLFKHAFKKYKINLPVILAKRIYDEALTLSLKSDMRANLFREAADLGNKYAAVEYGECIYDKDIEEATEYFIKGLPLQPAYWELGFILENNMLSEKKTKELATQDFYKNVCAPFYAESTKSFRLQINSPDEDKAESLRMAFVIYFYLAHDQKCGFSKAFNSLGKLMINDRVTIAAKSDDFSKEETRKQGLKYLRKAMDLGNTNAMVNSACFYYKQNKAGLYTDKKDTIVPMLEVAASLGEIDANVTLGNIFLENGDINSAREHLNFAHSKGRALATYKLGEICETNGDYISALSHYKTAMEKGISDAAYNYVLLASSPIYSISTNLPINNFFLSELLKKHLNRMTEEVRAKSIEYMEYLK